MDDMYMSPGGVILRTAILKPTGPAIVLPGITELFPWLDKKVIEEVKRKVGDGIVFMAGSLTNYARKSLGDLLLGKTAYAGETTIFAGLWAAAIDDTFNGATASECAYTSYGRHSMTNNTTNFATGTGTTTYTKTFPSDAVHSFAASTGTGTNNTVTYAGFLNGNAGTSADKGLMYTTITSTTINNGDTPQMAQNAFTALFS
jgi:hypothetical protein